MVGENFKRLSRENPLKAKLEKLELLRGKTWDSYIETLDTSLISKLESINFQIEETKYLLKNGVR